MKEFAKNRSYIDDLRLLQFVSSKNSMPVLNTINIIKSNVLHATDLDFDVEIKNTPVSYNSDYLYNIVFPKTETVLPNRDFETSLYPAQLDANYRDNMVMEFDLDKKDFINLCKLSKNKQNNDIFFLFSKEYIYLLGSNKIQLEIYSTNQRISSFIEPFVIKIPNRIQSLINKHRKNKVIKVVVYKEHEDYMLAFELYDGDIVIKLYKQEFQSNSRFFNAIRFFNNIIDEDLDYYKVDLKELRSKLELIYIMSKENDDGLNSCNIDFDSPELKITDDYFNKSVTLVSQKEKLPKDYFKSNKINTILAGIDSNGYNKVDSKKLYQIISNSIYDDYVYIAVNKDKNFIIAN